jgi:hypothetical protein
LQIAQRTGRNAIAMLIRRSKTNGADRALKDILLQTNPKKIKQQQEDADRARKELLEEEEKEKAAAFAGSPKKEQAKVGKSERKKENIPLQTNSKKTKMQQEDAEADRAMKELLEEEEKEKAAAFAGSQKKEQAKAGKCERVKEKEDQQKEETDFFRVWREPIELLEKVKGKRSLLAFGPWMQSIRETKYDFSKWEEEVCKDGKQLQVEYGGKKLQETNMPPTQAPKKMLNVGASEFVPSLVGFAEDGSGTGTMEGEDDLEVDVDRNMENDTAEDGLPGDLSEAQGLCANSDDDPHNLNLWYTDQVRKWYRHAV